MDMIKILNVVDEVKSRLSEIGLGHFGVDVITAGDNDKTPTLVVTYKEGIFGKQMGYLDRYWSTDLFMMWFEGRKNYLKLSPGEQAAIKVHPQQWEKEYISKWKEYWKEARLLTIC